jgi:hypothetical protein
LTPNLIDYKVLNWKVFFLFEKKGLEIRSE